MAFVVPLVVSNCQVLKFFPLFKETSNGCTGLPGLRGLPKKHKVWHIEGIVLTVNMVVFHMGDLVCLVMEAFLLYFVLKHYFL